jgi:hypothetical protein
MIGLNKIINELVDSDGKKIGGEDGGVSVDDAIMATNSTTDDFVRSSRQGMNRYLYRGFYGEDEDSDELELPPGDETRYSDENCDEEKDDLVDAPFGKGKVKRTPRPPKKGDKNQPFKKKSKDLDEAANGKMSDIIEDIFTKKKFDDEIVRNYRDNQVRLNGIPPLDSIRDTNPILIRKVSVLKDIIEKNDATGEEKAVILNHLLDMDLFDVPREYKEELKKKLA